MTAKEQLKLAEKAGSVMIGNDYIVFRRKPFAKYKNQLCKEQREICAKNAEKTKWEIGLKLLKGELKSSNYSEEINDSILNAPKP